MLQFGALQIYFVSMLPGLGKSTISDESHENGLSNIFDLEDLIENRKLFYRENFNFNDRKLGYKGLMDIDDNVQKTEDIKDIIHQVIKFAIKRKFTKVYIFSSIWWDHIGYCQSDLFVSITPSLYNGATLLQRGRSDLADKFSDNILYDWANGYKKHSSASTNEVGTFVSIELLPEEFLTTDRLSALMINLHKDYNPEVILLESKDNNAEKDKNS